MRAVAALWRREIVRFLRQRSRVIGSLAQPVVFWLLLGGGLSASFRPGAAASTSYLEYFYTGSLALVLLFTAIFATISVVEDRRGGFLQGVLVAPVSRTTIVLGQALGATTLGVGQGLLFVLLAPLAGIALGGAMLAGTLAASMLVAFGLSNIGLAIAWRMESTQGFHAIMNLVLLPIWFLSGAFFPPAGLPAPLRAVMALDPLTYGVGLLRHALYAGHPARTAELPSLAVCLAVSAGFAAASLAVATATARRSGVL
ncbi:MAG TPA: ABC transporter permease [Candidatus Limnocylindria bacterium]|nr:ABC transporter permease [Candidatus Limnocylindria bacterium]